MLLISYVRGLLIGVPHRVRLNVADDKVFEAYRELIDAAWGVRSLDQTTDSCRLLALAGTFCPLGVMSVSGT
jgi:hypothetical protein